MTFPSRFILVVLFCAATSCMAECELVTQGICFNGLYRFSDITEERLDQTILNLEALWNSYAELVDMYGSLDISQVAHYDGLTAEFKSMSERSSSKQNIWGYYDGGIVVFSLVNDALACFYRYNVFAHELLHFVDVVHGTASNEHKKVPYFFYESTIGGNELSIEWQNGDFIEEALCKRE